MLHVLRIAALVVLCQALPVLGAPRIAQPDAADVAQARESGRRIVSKAASGQIEDHSRRRLIEAFSHARRHASDFRMPSVDHLPAPQAEAVAKARRDIARLLADPDTALDRVLHPHPKQDASLIIFVSFSMPKTALRRYLAQAARAGGTVVLRGFVGGSMKATLRHILDLIYPDGLPKDKAHARPPEEYEGLALAIDPTLYSRFRITHVPAFVLTAGRIPACTPQGCPVPEHLRLAGDVGLPYALELMERESRSPQLAALAGRFRSTLEVVR